MNTTVMAKAKAAFRPAEACEAYGLSRTKVFNMIRDGQLRTVKVGRARLILRSSLDALLQEAA